MILLALIICAVKFPFIGRGPDLSGIPADTWPRIAQPGRWLHDMTNLAVEAVRADAQWFTKCLSFVALLASILLILTVAI